MRTKPPPDELDELLEPLPVVVDGVTLEPVWTAHTRGRRAATPTRRTPTRRSTRCARIVETRGLGALAPWLVPHSSTLEARAPTPPTTFSRIFELHPGRASERFPSGGSRTLATNASRSRTGSCCTRLGRPRTAYGQCRPYYGGRSKFVRCTWSCRCGGTWAGGRSSRSSPGAGCTSRPSTSKPDIAALDALCDHLVRDLAASSLAGAWQFVHGRRAKSGCCATSCTSRPKTAPPGTRPNPGHPCAPSSPTRPASRSTARALVVEPDERVPAVDEIAERERDVDPVARSHLWAAPGEAVRIGRAVRCMRLEHGSARPLHLVVAEQRPPSNTSWCCPAGLAQFVLLVLCRSAVPEHHGQRAEDLAVGRLVEALEVGFVAGAISVCRVGGDSVRGF